MGKKSSKPADVTGAASVEGEYSRDTARDATYADRPDQYNPFGSIQWQQSRVIDPATGQPTTKWTQNQSMSSDSQSIYDPVMNFLGDRANLADSLQSRVESEMGDAPDWEQFGSGQNLAYDPTTLRQAAEDAAYKKQALRLDSRFDGEAEAMEVRLRNQGLAPGDQAYDAQMRTFTEGKNDAFEQARLGSSQIGAGEAQQLFSQQMASTEFANALRDRNIEEYLAKRGFSKAEADSVNPLNDLNSLASIFSGGSTSSGGS